MEMLQISIISLFFLQAYVRNFIDPLVPRIREANRLGQNLIQSADPRVNTSVLERDMEKMNDRWNKLNAKVSIGGMERNNFELP